jgi:hypothetical protein
MAWILASWDRAALVPGEERAATGPSAAEEESEREEEERGRAKRTFFRSSLTS